MSGFVCEPSSHLEVCVWVFFSSQVLCLAVPLRVSAHSGLCQQRGLVPLQAEPIFRRWLSQLFWFWFSGGAALSFNSVVILV